MYVAVVPNRNSPPAILLRESFRENGKVHNRTIANLSHWPPDKVDALRAVLKGATALGAPLPQAFDIVRSRPHGHVAAVLGTMRKLHLDRLFDKHADRNRDLVLAMIAARVLEPASKLATSRALHPDTLSSTLGELLHLDSVTEDELYEAMDWLLPQQARIEKDLAKRHLAEGSLVLYDLTSTYFEGRHCPLGKLGHSRDDQKGKLQVVFGLLTNAEGCPVAVEVYAGNTSDPKTVSDQVIKLRQRFGLQRVILVGDRGMITSARLRENLKPAAGIEWITALRAPAIKKLAAAGVLQLSLFDSRDLAEITHPDFPGERLVACYNPLLAEERARKRPELLAATEKELEKIAVAARRKGVEPLQNGKAFSSSDRRRQLHLYAQTNQYREGRIVGWYLCHSHQRRRRSAVQRASGAQLQELVGCGARLSQFENCRSARAPHPSSPTRSCPRSYLSLHADLLRGMAHAPESGAP